jgi:hypothetical protein
MSLPKRELGASGVEMTYWLCGVEFLPRMHDPELAWFPGFVTKWCELLVTAGSGGLR